jgi:thiamine pyrophosphokinase
MHRMKPPEIELLARRHPSRRRERAVVLALTGATVGELRLALACAMPYHREPMLVAVDGGLATCRAAGRRPDLFVGDLDSARAAPKGVPATIYPAAKSFSDFAGALAQARRVGADVVVVAGLLGGRLDHEWANLLEMGAAAPRFAGLLAPGRRGLVVVTARGLRASALGGRLVSVFALGAAARVSLRGTRWTLANRRLSPGSLGLSNVAGDALELVVHAGIVALVVPAVRA